MESILVHLAAATICFAQSCYPALIGAKTPEGTFPVIHMRVKEPGYGGDVLAFAQDDTGVFAIHRVWTQVPKQHREARLASGDVTVRQDVTAGCVNVAPVVYDKLVAYSRAGTQLVIEP